MAPSGRTLKSNMKNCRESAVLLLIYKEKAQFRIVFIKRNEYKGPHSGQISFPGGMVELSDPDYAYTALRETEEETGLNRSEIEILGKLSPLYIPVSNFCVEPYVGWMSSIPDFKPDKNEVQYLICALLSELADIKNRKSGKFIYNGQEIVTPHFEIEGEIIWGATAMILNEFMALIGY